MPVRALLNWHAETVENALQALQTDPGAGLATVEVSARLTEDGPNELPEARHKPLWKVFAAQFASPLIYILFVAAVVAFARIMP